MSRLVAEMRVRRDAGGAMRRQTSHDCQVNEARPGAHKSLRLVRLAKQPSLHDRPLRNL